jgi:hypothetical protein
MVGTHSYAVYMLGRRENWGMVPVPLPVGDGFIDEGEQAVAEGRLTEGTPFWLALGW